MKYTFFPHLFLAFTLLGSDFSWAKEDGKNVSSTVLQHSHKDPQFGAAISYRKVPGTKGSLALVIEGKRLYALEASGLSIYNIEDPLHPKKLGHVGGMGNVRQLAVRGSTAFLTSRQCGLWAVDVSDEKNPRILSNFDAVEMSTGLDVVGDIAFIGNRVYGIQCVDVSDPKKMKHLSSYQTDESQSVHYANGLLFSGDWAGGEITILEVSNITQPQAISRIHLDGYGDGMMMRDHILFASTGQHRKSGPESERHGAGHGLDIFDVSDPLNPKKLSSTKFPKYYFGPCDYWTPRVSGNYCFASDTINGLFVLDISDLESPKILGNLVLPKQDPEDPKIGIPYPEIANPEIPQGDPIASIAVGDGVLYMAGNFTGIYLAELPDKAKIEERRMTEQPQLPKVTPHWEEKGFYSSGLEVTNPTRAVAIRGDIAYTANVWDGVKIYRLHDKGIEQIGKLDIEYAADVKLSGDRLYVAEGMNGLAAYQVISDTEVKELGRLIDLKEGLNFVQFVWAFEGTDIVASTSAGTRVSFVDFSTPSKPDLYFQGKGIGLLYGPYGSQKLVNQRYFAFARHCAGLVFYDLKDKSKVEVWHDRFPLCSQTGAPAAMGDKFLVMRAGGYAFVDPTKPVKNQEMKRVAFPEQMSLPEDVPDDSPISRAMFPKSEWEGLANFDESTGKLAVMNRIFKKLRIYDFSDRANPKLLKTVETHSNLYVPAFWKGRVVLPGAYSGLLLEK